MGLLAPVSELREKYKDVLGNKDIQSVSRWNETNHSDECSEENYLAKALADAEPFMDKIEKAIQGI